MALGRRITEVPAKGLSKLNCLAFRLAARTKRISLARVGVSACLRRPPPTRIVVLLPAQFARALAERFCF